MYMYMYTDLSCYRLSTGLSERVYLVCCRDGDYRPCKQPRLTEKRRPNQKKSRKLDDVCISRMYANVFDDGHVNVTYVTAHTNHKPGPPEDAYLPLPNGTRQEIALKLANGIPPERIMEGVGACQDNNLQSNTKFCVIIYTDIRSDVGHRSKRAEFHNDATRKHFVNRQDIANVRMKVKDLTVI